ncbi:MAG TPA: hypothetical protein VGC82_22040, partial [Rhodopila sp.]
MLVTLSLQEGPVGEEHSEGIVVGLPIEAGLAADLTPAGMNRSTLSSPLCRLMSSERVTAAL